MSNSSTKVLAKRGKNWVQVTTDPDGKKTEQEVAPTPTAIGRYNRLAAQRAPQKPQQDLSRYDQSRGRPKPIADIRGTGSDRFEREKSRLLNVGEPSTKPPKPEEKPKEKPAAGTGSTPPSKPAAPKPAAPKPASPQGFERRAATGDELRAAQFARQSALASNPKDTKGAEAAAVNAGVQRAQLSKGQPISGPAPTQAQMSAAGAAAKAAASKVKKESYDAYDLVLEYLLSQGHAETIAEAHYVMMEMDSEMIGGIVEEVLKEGDNYDKNRKRAAQRAAARNAARDAGKTGAVPGVGYVTPRRERETYRDSAGTERHKSGARMPEKKG